MSATNAPLLSTIPIQQHLAYLAQPSQHVAITITEFSLSAAANLATLLTLSTTSAIRVALHCSTTTLLFKPAQAAHPMSTAADTPIMSLPFAAALLVTQLTATMAYVISLAPPPSIMTLLRNSVLAAPLESHAAPTTVDLSPSAVALLGTLSTSSTKSAI